MIIITSKNSEYLTASIASKLALPYLTVKKSIFADGEIYLQIPKILKGQKIIIIHSTSNPCNDNLIELFLLIDAAKRQKPIHLTVVIPYLAYMRQERITQEGQALPAQLIIQLIENAGADRIITLDLHSKVIEQFFTKPFLNLSTTNLFLPYIRKITNFEIISPDKGGLERAINLAKQLNKKVIQLDKIRPEANKCIIGPVVENIKGKNCIIIDDIVDTAGTLTQAAELLHQAGAHSISAFATHPILSNRACEKITNSYLIKIYVTDTIYKDKLPTKFEILSAAEIIAEGILKNDN